MFIMNYTILTYWYFLYKYAQLNDGYFDVGVSWGIPSFKQHIFIGIAWQIENQNVIYSLLNYGTVENSHFLSYWFHNGFLWRAVHCHNVAFLMKNLCFANINMITVKSVWMNFGINLCCVCLCGIFLIMLSYNSHSICSE